MERVYVSDDGNVTEMDSADGCTMANGNNAT